MEVLQLQQLLAAQSQSNAWPSSFADLPATASSAFDVTALQLQLLLLQQQSLPATLPASLSEPLPSLDSIQRSGSLSSSMTSSHERVPFRDLHAQTFGGNVSPAPVSFSKPSQAALASIPRSLSGCGGRWTSPADQRDVLITEQLALIKTLNDTIAKQKQAAVEADAVRCALEATIVDLRKQSSGLSSPSYDSSNDSEEASFPNEAQVAYYKEHAEHWSRVSHVDRQQLIQVLRTLIASNKRYQQPLPPMCVKPECRCRNCWFLHAQIDETAWSAAWELHMWLR